ncbi:VPS10 domain-containing receptor SorCS1-like isoform X2 [Anguilla anguilla]|uniref:VPS10 domain-containing receptor SorCS1-like isoform X2 n=1 Tax=Anguilla anguilla TaxID=7936 RepID=UPI0015B20790|nr:VPS10 domain-containing receptor SorCS1-like isoform X2 [Anguilla anguilla]
MGNGFGTRPFRNAALWLLVLIFASALPGANAGITCRSCQPAVAKPLPRELVGAYKMDTGESATGSEEELGMRHGNGAAVNYPKTDGTHHLDCASQSLDCVSDQNQGDTSHHLSRKLKPGHLSQTFSRGQSGAIEVQLRDWELSKISDLKKKQGGLTAKTVISPVIRDKTIRDNSSSSLRSSRKLRKETKPTSKQIGGSRTWGSRRERSTSLAGRRFTRSAFRGSSEESRTTHSRPDELKLTSSTFALTGDSAHNQAMVHWSGQNSSVILMLTKHFDFNLGSVTESSLWRSTDYGTTYEKLNEKVGAKTILSYLYVSPNNKRKIMLLTDPEVENSLLISLDEGATYQKYRLSFYILSLLFHPQQEDWILAYSHDQKLYSSVEFGRKWQLVHEKVAPNRFYWSKMGLDSEPGLIHLETRISEGQSQYVTCKVQNCTEANKGKPFPGYIDPNSLVVQDEYAFVQVSARGQPVYYVSYKRNAFTPIKLPKYTFPKDLHVIGTDESRVVAAVQEWNQNDTYNLYVSDSGGVLFTLALENVMSSMGPEGNVMIDLYEPYCSLHLHLHVSDYPYSSGNIASKDSAPGIIVASGSIGAELTMTNVTMFITSDAGNTWSQIFEDEYSVLYLDQGGALVAIRHTPLPIRHLWLSFDEGRFWNKYSFTSTPLFVDGVLGEPGEETLIMIIFGHVSHRSEWQLVKIDFRSIFNRRCTEEDYQTWHLHNQGEPCLMGVKRIYRKLKPTARCVMGKDYSVTMTSEPCDCTEADFECDYGYERNSGGRCSPAFWFSPSSMSRVCTTGKSFLNSTGYRKLVSDNCTSGVLERYTARAQKCPAQAPRGLRLVTRQGSLTAARGANVTFLVFLLEGDGSKTSVRVDFGDGNGVSYSNVSSIEDGVRHVYRSVGIYRVTATAENALGSDRVSLYLHVTCPLERIHLSAPLVVAKGREVNLTTVLSPSHVGAAAFIWWFANHSEPLITLESSVAFTFPKGGSSTVTVQVVAGSVILQDRKTIAVHEYFRSHLLAFSSNLDEHNPDVSEWRLDISRVVKSSMVQATGISEEQLLVTVLPGLPTTAEVFLLPDKELTEGEEDRTAEPLDQLSEVLLGALNQNRIEFTLRPGVQITVYATHLSVAPLVDSSESQKGSAVLLLLSVVFVGLIMFIIYKFRRKIPGLSFYAQMQNEKEREMIRPDSAVEKSPGAPRELVASLELLDTELDAQAIGYLPSHLNTKFSKEPLSCVTV